MSFKEYLNELLCRQIDKHPKTTSWCLIAAMVGCGVGSYKLAEYLSSISLGVKTFFTILGVPVLIGLLILILYIIWKFWQAIGKFVEQSHNSCAGPFGIRYPLYDLLNTLANNKIEINIEVEKKPEEEKPESQDATPSSTSEKDT